MRSTLTSLLSCLALCLLLTGCYQAKMTTSKPAGDTVVEKKWASSYLNGLVPATIDVSDDCPNGIASAEREFSFLNGLVSGLTLGIYLPQTVTVTCAAGGSMSSAAPPSKTRYPLSEDATAAQVQRAISAAAPSIEEEATVHLRLR